MPGVWPGAKRCSGPGPGGCGGDLAEELPQRRSQAQQTDRERFIQSGLLAGPDPIQSEKTCGTGKPMCRNPRFSIELAPWQVVFAGYGCIFFHDRTKKCADISTFG